MNTVIREYIQSLGGSSRAFPPSLSNLYAQVIEEYRSDNRAQGFESMAKPRGLEDPTVRGVAHRVYWWFPTHLFKFQDALLRWEERCGESGRPFLLGRPSVTFVDVGCGAGAASAAALATLEEYQEYRRRRGHRVDRLKVSLLGLDPVEAELEAYERLIRDYAGQLDRCGISSTVRTLVTDFPEGVDQVVDLLSTDEGHALIVGMSNLINWIWVEWEEPLSEEQLRRAETCPPAEVEAFQRIAEGTDFDLVHVVGVATRDRGRGARLRQKLRDFADIVLAVTRRKRAGDGERWSCRAKVLFANPENSGWVCTSARWTSDYFVENIVSLAPSYATDRRLGEVLSMTSLEAAWAKVRTYMWYESLRDEVELRLFEQDLQASLSALRAACEDRDYACLNVQHDQGYGFPKSDGTMRPRVLPRLEDQIVATSVGIEFGKELQGLCPHVSYSYRLAPRQTEFLYEYWFALYREYLSDILRNLDASHVCAADIESYYVNISQATLLSLLGDRLGSSERCCGLLSASIDRDCGPPHATGYGVLQGHALSGLMANVMLQPVDNALVKDCGMSGKYFRFTDDMTVLGAEEVTQSATEVIQEELDAVDENLQLNEGKTRHYDAKAFRRRAYGSKQLDALGKRFKALLLPLYVLSRSYRREFDRGEWEFAHQYQDLLARLGLSFTPEWLCRKLDEYRRPWRRAKAIRRKWKPRWPSVSLIRTEVGRRQWREEYEGRNANWVQERQSLKSELSQLLIAAAADILQGGLSEENEIRRRRELKFALYRLSVFGVERALREIEQLLVSQPWNIPVGIACHALGRAQQGDVLVAVVRSSQSEFVRATALRALGRVRTTASVSMLASVLDEEAHPAERLMASEALIAINLWQDVDFDTIVNWLQREASAPYIQKNIVLILAQAYPDRAAEALCSIDGPGVHSIVHNSVHYALHKVPAENLLWAPEPDALKRYRAIYYPLIEELLGDPGSYGIISE